MARTFQLLLITAEIGTRCDIFLWRQARKGVHFDVFRSECDINAHARLPACMRIDCPHPVRPSSPLLAQPSGSISLGISNSSGSVRRATVTLKKNTDKRGVNLNVSIGPPSLTDSAISPPARFFVPVLRVVALSIQCRTGIWL